MFKFRKTVLHALYGSGLFSGMLLNARREVLKALLTFILVTGILCHTTLVMHPDD